MSDYKALYRKWRPVDFDDVSGQDSITDILKYEVANNRVSHAYLFCGSRGTGKTSCAKILAKAVNCLNPKGGNPCNVCEACRSIDTGTATDVIEMDAASNNGVGDVRDLKDEINFTPAILKYRVYIIDEVHMMSGAAFNALLKTLEEPPSYVVFILATTEYNKLPTTIVSRCQRFDFKRISADNIISRLKRISEEEGILLEDDGARLIARASRGGMRDAVSFLELCAGARVKIDARLVCETIGSGDRSSVYNLIAAIARSDYDTVYSVINDVVMGSGDISVFWQEIIDSYRDIMVVKNTEKALNYLDLTEVEYNALKELAKSFSTARLAYHTSLLESAMADMQRAVNSKRSIAEIAITRMCDAKLVSTPEALALRVEELEKTVSIMKLGASPVTVGAPIDIQEKPVEIKLDEVSQKPLEIKNETHASTVYEDFGAVIDRLSEIKPSLAGRLRGAKAYRIRNNAFLLEVNSVFYASIVSNGTDISIIKGIIAEYERASNADIELEIKELKSGDGLSSELDSLINL